MTDQATTGQQGWQPLLEAAAGLEHEELINRVVKLAADVRGGAGHLVDQLVIHARVLDYRYEERGTGYPMWRASTPRLAEMQPQGLAAQTPDDPMVETSHMVDGEGGPMYVATTAGFIRRTFGAGPTPAKTWLRPLCLETLPGELSQDDTTPVVLYGSKGSASLVLSAVRDGLNPDKPIAHLVARVVHHHPFPWEPGGWNGD